MADKAEVWQGTLALMVLKTLETLGPLHGYGIARRIEQTSGDNALPELRHAVPRAAEAGAGGLHRVGVGAVREQPQGEVLQADPCRRKQVERETLEWERTTGILARFLSPERPSKVGVRP